MKIYLFAFCDATNYFSSVIGFVYVKQFLDFFNKQKSTVSVW